MESGARVTLCLLLGAQGTGEPEKDNNQAMKTPVLSRHCCGDKCVCLTGQELTRYTEGVRGRGDKEEMSYRETLVQFARNKGIILEFLQSDAEIL